MRPPGLFFLTLVCLVSAVLPGIAQTQPTPAFGDAAAIGSLALAL